MVDGIGMMEEVELIVEREVAYIAFVKGYEGCGFCEFVQCVDVGYSVVLFFDVGAHCFWLCCKDGAL